MQQKYINKLTFVHIFIIVISNLLVQHPFMLFGFHTTWGAFTYPFIFITTDLTIRLLGQNNAKAVIIKAMLPGLLISYVMSVLLSEGQYNGLESLAIFNFTAFRISFACFMAYIMGQFLDVMIFQKLRVNSKWWVAPTVASGLGNLVDTMVFFFLAFYNSENPVLRDHWFEIAEVEFCFKYFFTLACFVPLYGVILNRFLRLQLKPL